MWAFFRLVHASFRFGVILASYLLQLLLRRLFGAAAVEARWQRVHRKNAQRMYRGILRLRGVYIKLGQVLSIMGTFLPRAYSEELEGLQDQVPPHPWREVEQTFLDSLGKRPRELFDAFDEAPIAAASLGQVHRATLPDGTKVAVKILYPRISTVIRIDLRVIRWIMTVYGWFMPVNAIHRVVEQLEDLLRRETDLRHEATCMEQMERNFASDPDLLFPKVDWDRTSDHVLTMTFMEGVKISRRDEIVQLGLDPTAVAKKLVEAFYKMLFLDRFFHADPHPGNFLVQKGPAGQPRIVVLDFGAASEARPNLIDGMIDVLSGLVGRDDGRVLRGIETMGFYAEGGDRALLERTVKLYFQKLLELNLKDFSSISPETAQKFIDPEVKRDELRQLMRAVEYPEGWFYIERAVVMLFGLSAQLAPTLNTIAVGFPYLMAEMAKRMAATPPPTAG